MNIEIIPGQQLDPNSKKAFRICLYANVYTQTYSMNYNKFSNFKKNINEGRVD